MRTAIINGHVSRRNRGIPYGGIPRGPIDLTFSRPAPDVVVVHVGGEIDMLTAPDLWSAVAGRMDPPPRVLVIDLRAVTFLGASGLAVLLDIRETANWTGTSVRLVCAAPVVTRPLNVMGFREVFGMFAELEAALAGAHTAPAAVVRSSPGSD